MIHWRRDHERHSTHGELHDVSGSWVTPSGREPSAAQKDNWAFDRLLRHNARSEFVLYPNAACPQCHQEVYFLRHRENGGCAWFDSIPPDTAWEKHPCMDIPDTKCISDNSNLQENGVVQLPPANYPPKPEWMTFRSRRIYSHHRQQAPKPPPDERDIAELFGSPLKKMRRLSAHQSGLEKPDWDCLHSMYVLGRPHRHIQSIISWSNSTNSKIYDFYDRGVGHQVVIPLTLMRSINFSGKSYIAARSFLFPAIGIWLEVEIGLRDIRNIHGLLHWERNTPTLKQVTFINPGTARLNWRDVIAVGGAFSEKICPRSKELTTPSTAGRRPLVIIRPQPHLSNKRVVIKPKRAPSD